MNRINRIDLNVNSISDLTYTSGGTLHYVITPTNVIYIFYIDAYADIVYSKSIDGGYTWTNVVITATSATNIAIWYDRWSGIDANIVHIAYIESITNDIWYRSINLANDSLTSAVAVFAGASTLAGGCLSITRARGGNLMIAGAIDAGTEYDTVMSTNGGANWSSIAEALEGAVNDQIILVPGWNADNQDIMAFFWDADANEVSVKRYDNSANSWAETSIATSMTDRIPRNGAGAYQFRAAVDLVNSRNVLVAASAVTMAVCDGRIFIVDDTTVTENTNFFTDNIISFCVAIQITSAGWYVYYAGTTGESYIACTIYRRFTSDAGVNWGTVESLLLGKRYVAGYLICPQTDFDSICNIGYRLGTFNIPFNSGRAAYQLGI